MANRAGTIYQIVLRKLLSPCASQLAKVIMNKELPNNKSNYDPSQTARHFDEYGMREWERLTATPAAEVSLHIHTHYLQKYVPPGARVLEIGAGAGRFTQILTELGTRIWVADLSPAQLELNQEHANRFGFAHAVEAWIEADICNLSQFPSATFDCVVAYGGPLSYVLGQREQAMGECARVLKRDGRFLSSVMSLWGSAHLNLQGVLAIPPATNQRITTTGDISPETFPEREGSYMHMFRANEFRRLISQADLSVLALSASNCLSLCWNDYLTEIRHDARKWEELLRMELEACADPASLNAGTHIIGVAAKI
ncbi:MAG: class I SAM-dependent methyltransferase [Chloroflexi bacterium]|nr:class I SAM-dependent methyltransferase [Chloroflexota bacterium]